MNKLFDYIQKGKSQYQLIQKCIDELVDAGFIELSIDDEWNLVEGGKYYISPFSSVLFSFVIGNKPKGFRIATSHVDFPGLKLKSNPIVNHNGYTKVNVEPYGGLILSTWFDRPLGLAGKIILKGNKIFKPETIMFDSPKPLFVIPNLAPHMKGKDKTEIEVQKEIMPLFAMGENESSLIDYISKELNINKDKIIDYDLYLYNCEEPRVIGAKDEFILSPRMDNITSVTSVMEGLLIGDVGDCIAVGAFFDNEEIGSKSKQGADSILLRNVIDKILNSKDLSNTISWDNNFMVSLDVAHGYHPNYADKSDITNFAILGQGVALKTSAAQKYLTDSEASAVVTQICNQNNIKLQKQVNKSGMPGGQTLGPITSSYLPIRGVDMGVPMLAMHSAAELISINDYYNLKQFVKVFFATKY